jgi:hypothetical protein
VPLVRRLVTEAIGREWDSSAFAEASARSHPVSDAISPELASIHRERRRMAEKVGFELFRVLQIL